MPAKDSLTMALEGEITLGVLSSALDSLQGLLGAISSEVAANADIRWVVTGLESGSATLTMQGIEKNQNQAPVTRVVEAYEEIGESLQSNAPSPHRLGPAVALRTSDLRNLITSNVIDIRMETEDFDAIIMANNLVPHAAPPSSELPRGPKWSYGSIEGLVQAATIHNQKRFTLYEVLHDRAVACYLLETQQDLITENWGKRVRVHGRVTRDPNSGRPLTIRRITNIEKVEEPPSGAWRAAKGAVPWQNGDSLPEVVIRNSRDA